MKYVKFFLTLSVIFLVVLNTRVNAGWKNTINGLLHNHNTSLPQANNNPESHITYGEKQSALKQALEIGVKYAVSNLSKTNGFLDNPYVKIPVPQYLKTATKVLKSVGQKKLVDSFVAEMNHAAEKATPKTINIFIKAIKQMSIKDATKILTGPDNAATEYFRQHTYKNLFRTIKPIVKQSTSKTEATKYYKEIIDKYRQYKQPINTLSTFKNMLKGKQRTSNKEPPSDLDTYITQKTIQGIFFMIAQEEKKIRNNPIARTTNLLKKVFGHLKQ